MQADAYNPTGPFYTLGDRSKPLSGRILRLHGLGLLSELTAETGTMETNELQAQYLCAFAREIFALGMRAQAGSQQKAEFDYMIDRARDDQARWRNMDGVRVPLPPLSPSKAWHVERDSSNRYLILDGYRG